MVKVVDLSCDVAGGFASKLLAMAGLDVVRPGASDTSHLSRYLHGHKQLVGWVDEAAHAGALLADADVVFTTFDQGGYVGVASSLRRPLRGSCVEVTTSTYQTATSHWDRPSKVVRVGVNRAFRAPGRPRTGRPRRHSGPR